MGFSYTRRAGDTLRAMVEACLEETKTQNVWTYRKRSYFFEEIREDRPDGSIWGVVFLNHADGVRCTLTGYFRIDPEGHVCGKSPRAFCVLAKRAGVELA